MTHYPEALREHLAGHCTTTCHAWRLTRRDGTVSGFSDHDMSIEVDGTACLPHAGFSASEAQRSLGFAIDTTDVEGVLSSTALDGEEIEAGLFDDATVETFLVNWRTPSDFALLRKATVGRITRRDGSFLAELKGPMHALDQPSARCLARACDAELGDARCGFDPDQPGFTGMGAVVDGVAPHAFRVSGLSAFEADWFTHGALTWTSGRRAGRSDRVVDHRRQAGEAVLYMAPIPGAQPEAGDTFSIVAGCDKKFATCRTKFANGDNFRGFPHLPGNDSAYAYVTDGLVFDGGPIVP